MPGLYAAGDTSRGLNQISVATGEAAIAATAMHVVLRERERERDASAGGGARDDAAPKEGAKAR